MVRSIIMFPANYYKLKEIKEEEKEHNFMVTITNFYQNKIKIGRVNNSLRCFRHISFPYLHWLTCHGMIGL